MNKLSIAIMAVLVLLLAACQITVQPTLDQPPNRITVTGNSQLKAVPDEATISLHVETEGSTAKEAQDSNSEIMTTVQKALKRAGVRSDEMETTNYNLYPNSYWDPDERRQKQSGFRATHTLRIKTTDLPKVGELIQIGVDAGATRADRATFSLSDDGKEEAQAEALRRAVDDARSKAEALADSLDLRVGKVSSVSISNYYVTPFYAEARAMSVDEAAPAPPISPREVDVSANVQVVFNIA